MRVGVFDSGIGGVTVLDALRARFPEFEFVYLGDTANVPYGTKSPAQIRKLSVACALRLKDRRVDAVVVACNTASSWALDEIREAMGNVPVFGVVEPGIEAVLRALAQLEATRKKRVKTAVLVLATRATVNSGAYGKVLRKILEPGRHKRAASTQAGSGIVMEQACPLLVPMIEEGWVDHPILHQTIAEYVKPYLEKYPSGVAILGCTHYPWIQKAFEKALPGWIVLNSAEAVADSLSKYPLVERVRRAKARSAGPRKREVEWIFTDPEAVPEFAREMIWPAGRRVVKLFR